MRVLSATRWHGMRSDKGNAPLSDRVLTVKPAEATNKASSFNPPRLVKKEAK